MSGFSVGSVQRSAFTVPATNGLKRPISAVVITPEIVKKKLDEAIRSLNSLIRQHEISLLCEGADWIDRGTGCVRMDLPKTREMYSVLGQFCQLIQEADDMRSGVRTSASHLVSAFKFLEENSTSPEYAYNLDVVMHRLAGPNRAETIVQLRDYFASGIPTLYGSDSSAPMAFAHAGDMRRQREGELVQFVRAVLGAGDSGALTQVVPDFLDNAALLVTVLTEPRREKPSERVAIAVAPAVLFARFSDSSLMAALTRHASGNLAAKQLLQGLLPARVSHAIECVNSLLEDPEIATLAATSPWLDSVAQCVRRDLAATQRVCNDLVSFGELLVECGLEFDGMQQNAMDDLTVIKESNAMADSKLDIHAIVRSRNARGIQVMMAGLPPDEVVGVFVDMCIRSTALARDWVHLSPELVQVVLADPDESGRLWGALETAMNEFVGAARMGMAHAKYTDVVGAIYSAIVGRNEDGSRLEAQSDRLSEAALKTILTYCFLRRDTAAFLKIVSSGLDRDRGRLWAAATDRFHLIDPSDPDFIVNTTRIAVTPSRTRFGAEWDRVDILRFVNPELLEFHRHLTQLIGEQIPTDVANLGRLQALLKNVKHWNSDILKINLLGSSGVDYLLRLVDFHRNQDLPLEFRQAISNVLVGVIERPGNAICANTEFLPSDYATLGLGAAKPGQNGKVSVNVSIVAFLIENLMLSEQPVELVLGSGMPIVYREPSMLCTTKVPVPFNGVVLLDPMATRTLLTAFPLAIRQVAGNQMTIAQMAVKGLRDRIMQIGGARDFEARRAGLIERFGLVFELCLDFGDLSGVDLRRPLVADFSGTEASPYTPQQFVDGFLPAYLSPTELEGVARLLARPARGSDGEFTPEFLARASANFPSFLGDIRRGLSESGNRAGLFTADIDPQTQFAVVRRLGMDDHVDGRLLCRPTPESGELDLPTSVNIRYQSMIAQSIRLIAQIESGDPAGISEVSTLLKEYVDALPGTPLFSTFFIVNSLFLNTEFTSALQGRPDGSAFHQLGDRLVTLGRLVTGMTLFDGVVGQAGSPLTAAVERVKARPETLSSTLVAIGPVPQSVRTSAHSIYEALADLPTVVFSEEVQRLLTDIPLLETVGVVAIPHVDESGGILVGLRRAGDAQVYGRQYGGEFSPIFDAGLDVQLRNELHQVVVFPGGSSPADVSRILRFIKATAPESGEDVGTILGEPVAVMDIRGVIERCTGMHREILVTQGEDRSYVLHGRFEVALGSDDGLAPGMVGGLAVIQGRLLPGESPAVRLLDRFQTVLKTDDSTIFYRRSVLHLAHQLEMTSLDDGDILVEAIVRGLDGNRSAPFEAAVSLLSILTGQSLGVLNIRSRHPRSTTVGHFSEKTPIILWGSGPVRTVAATELPENYTVSSDTEDMLPGDFDAFSLFSGRVASGEDVATSNIGTIRTGPMGNTCWLESMVNVEAEQLRTAIGQPMDHYPPVTRMILSGLAGLDLARVTGEDRPKIEWMIRFLLFGAQVNQVAQGGVSTPVEIDPLAVGWEAAFGRPLRSIQEADSVANTVYDTLAKYSPADSVEVTVGLYSHPFGSIAAVRDRLDGETRVAPYPGADSTVVRVRTAEATPLLSDGVLEMNVQPETLFWETEATVAAEGLGVPPNPQVLRLAEARLPFSIHPSRLPATLQFRFATSGTHLNPSEFNPHRLNHSLVFQRGGALYAVSSLLGQPGGHWVSLFTGTVLPVEGQAPVFYEKLYNGSNAARLPQMTWSTAVEQYFSRYPAVVIRATRVPEGHSLHTAAMQEGLLTYPRNEQVLRTVVQDLLPDMVTADGGAAPIPIPTDWRSYIALLTQIAERFEGPRVAVPLAGEIRK